MQTFHSPSPRAASSTTTSTGGQTPKSSGRHQAPRRQNNRKAQSMSPQSQMAYASSSICSSPSARNVPMPPVEWLNQLNVPSTSRPSSSNSIASSASSSTSSESSSPAPSLSSSPMKSVSFSQEKLQMGGVRVCPLQLIAAVASA